MQARAGPALSETDGSQYQNWHSECPLWEAFPVSNLHIQMFSLDQFLLRMSFQIFAHFIVRTQTFDGYFLVVKKLDWATINVSISTCFLLPDKDKELKPVHCHGLGWNHLLQQNSSEAASHPKLDCYHLNAIQLESRISVPSFPLYHIQECATDGEVFNNQLKLFSVITWWTIFHVVHHYFGHKEREKVRVIVLKLQIQWQWWAI